MALASYGEERALTPTAFMQGFMYEHGVTAELEQTLPTVTEGDWYFRAATD